MECPKCTSKAWDYASVGLPNAILCTNCGHIFKETQGKLKMTEEEFERKFDMGELDCEFAMFISERYDAWAKHQMLSYWEDPDAYTEFKETMVKPTIPMPYFGDNPLDKFPSIWSKS